jgi:hypothetical protein
MQASSPNNDANVGRVSASVLSVLRSLVRDPRLKWARLLTALGLVVGLAELLGLGFWAGCGVMLFQSIVVPTSVGYLALARLLTPPQQGNLSSAVVAGTLTGGTLAAFQALIGPIQWFALGGESRVFAARGLPVPPITVSGVMAVIYTNIYILIASAIVSALGGLIGGILARHSLRRRRAIDTAQPQ